MAKELGVDGETDARAAGEGRGPYAALYDPAFLSLWRDVNNDVVSWEDFKQRDMPKGATAVQTWDAIALLRRWSGLFLGKNEGLKSGVWLNLPRKGRALARDIAARGSDESELGRWVLSNVGSAEWAGMQVEELERVFGDEGAAPGYEELRAVLLGVAPPMSAEETLARNYQAVLLDEVESSRRGSPGTASSAALYARLVEGVARLVPPVWNQPTASNIDKLVASVPRLDPYDVPPASLYIWGGSDMLGIVSPHGRLFGSVLRKVFLIRGRMTPLSLLPLSAEKRKDRPQQPEQNGVDGSETAMEYLEAMDRLLSRLEQLASRSHERRAGLVERLESVGALNMRQKRVLEELVEQPGAEYSYETFMERFQVSYNTARADLAQLEGSGLLARHGWDGARVFRAPEGYLGALGAWLDRVSGRRPAR